MARRSSSGRVARNQPVRGSPTRDLAGSLQAPPEVARPEVLQERFTGSHGRLLRFWPMPTQAEIAAIARMTDPVLRNLHITQTYHTLTLALTDLFGEENVSWCAYATWASKTAGFFIRKDVMPELVRDFLERVDALARSMGELQGRLIGSWAASVGIQGVLVRVLQQVMDTVARHIARGNLLVFEELAPLYAGLWEHCAGGERYDVAVLGRVIERLTPGSVEQGGQALLIRAFTHYYEAIFEDDARAQAERLFLANALVGYHEQARLQETIIGALSAPLRHLFLEQMRVELTESMPAGRANGLHELSLQGVFGLLATRIERLWRELSTRALMRIDLPDVTLRLGEDIPALNAERDFPPSLSRLEHPELLALMASLDRTPDDTAGSGARDWGDLADRMNLIVDLFRTRQQDRLMYDQPFTFMQVEAMRQGRVPHGRL